jgi:hypothetical protein
MARKDRVDRKHTGVTTVEENKNVTTGKRLPLRMTQHELDELDILTEKIQELMPRKKVSRSRVMRACVHIQDNATLKKIVKSISENT